MATYSYSATVDGSRTKGYVDFNISPAPTRIAIGSKLTISGRVYSRDVAIKSIRAFIGVELPDAQYGSIEFLGALGYTNKTIAKATQTTFSLTITISQGIWEYLRGRYQLDPSDPHTCQIIDIFFELCPKTASGSDVHYDIDDYTTPSGTVEAYLPDNTIGPNINGHTFTLADPVGVVIEDTSISDTASVSAITVLGNLVTKHSKPKMQASLTIDTDFIQTCTHSLTLSGAMSGTYTAETSNGVSSVNFDLPTPTTAGTVNWSYTVTDSFDNTDTETGSFTVYAYSPPAITNLLLERYAIVPDAGGDAHEAADDGTHLWLTLAAGIAAVNSRNAWTAVMTYWETALGESTAVTVTSQDGWTLGGTDGTVISLSRDETQLAGIVADDTKNYSFRLTITDALNNSATLVFDGIVKAGAVLDVSPGGVGVGMRCTGTEGGGELFQCAYPAEFKSNVAVGAGKLIKVVNVTVASSQSIAAATSGAYNAAVSPGTGWTPVWTVGTQCNNGRIVMRKVYLSGGRAYVEAFNTGTSSVTVNISADVLCIRTSL